MLHRAEQREKDRRVYGLLTVAACLILSFFYEEVRQERIGEKLRPAVLRFHVLAESDAAQDQVLKLQVRDCLITEIRGWIGEETEKEEVVDILSGHLEEMESLAEKTLRKSGCDLPVRVELRESWFPVRLYGQLLVPAGTYDALRVSIGSAEGQNWWCMLFPGLCYVEETYQATPVTVEGMEGFLTEEEFQTIWQQEETEVRVRFWLWKQLEHFVHRNRTNEELNSRGETCRIR